MPQLAWEVRLGPRESVALHPRLRGTRPRAARHDGAAGSCPVPTCAVPRSGRSPGVPPGPGSGTAAPLPGPGPGLAAGAARGAAPGFRTTSPYAKWRQRLSVYTQLESYVKSYALFPLQYSKSVPRSDSQPSAHKLNVPDGVSSSMYFLSRGPMYEHTANTKTSRVTMYFVATTRTSEIMTNFTDLS